VIPTWEGISKRDLLAAIEEQEERIAVLEAQTAEVPIMRRGYERRIEKLESLIDRLLVWWAEQPTIIQDLRKAREGK
jgi:hypothetical protein